MTWTDQGITFLGVQWSFNDLGSDGKYFFRGAPGIANIFLIIGRVKPYGQGANIRLPAGPITVIGSSSIAFGGADYSDASTAYLLTLTAPAITLNGVKH